jgi:hypothetical protein
MWGISWRVEMDRDQYIEKMSRDYDKKRKQVYRKVSRPVMVNGREFESLNKACRFTDLAPGTIKKYIGTGRPYRGFLLEWGEK